jgi:putative membrane protein
MSILLPTISTTFIVISGILVAFGWYAIAKRQIEKHMKIMKWAAICATIFFITYVSRTAFVGNTQFGGPDSLRPIYQTFLIFHIVLATVGGVMGLITLRFAYKKEFAKHRKIGPWTSVIWFITSITGATVYSLLYLIYPGGETSGVLDVIFGW